jgi:hypothetical protein
MKDGMLVLVIVWMTLMHNHHAIKSRIKDCYCLVGNEKCNLVIGFRKLKMIKYVLCLNFKDKKFFYVMIPSRLQGFCELS